MHYLYVFFCADAPFSKTYRLNESTIFSPLHHPVHITIDVTAYPRTVAFQWYFNTSSIGWVSVNASDYQFNITRKELSTTLTVNELELNLTGAYRVEVYNGIRSTKVYGFTVRPAGMEISLVMQISNKGS